MASRRQRSPNRTPVLRNTGVRFPTAPLAIPSVDYLRLTFPEPFDQFWLPVLLDTVVSVAGTQGPGFQRRVWGKSGYRGFRQGMLFWGQRTDGIMVEASGMLAHTLAFAVPLPDQFRCPRLDLAMTLWYDDDQSGLIERGADLAVERRATDGRRRRMKIVYIDGKGGGNTLNLGTRTSAENGRFYDKWRQSKFSDAYLYALRYETEYHNKAALAVFEKLFTSARPEDGIAATVSGWWQERGVPVGFDALEELAVSSRVERAKNDDERRLAWIRTAVGPTVRQLLTNGHLSGTLDALGCDGLIWPIVPPAGWPDTPVDPSYLFN